jgi:uncharacterized protein with HEPN domain
MTNETKARILSHFNQIISSADAILDYTKDMEETDEIDDARNYFWHIREEAEEALGQWWA